LIAAAGLLGVVGAAWAGSGEDLIAAQKCARCHTGTTTKKGPSFASIAAKYGGDAAAADKLFTLLKTGGTDEHVKPVASDAELRAVVAVVLSAK
jgi:cytochrome c551/c552